MTGLKHLQTSITKLILKVCFGNWSHNLFPVSSKVKNDMNNPNGLQ